MSWTHQGKPIPGSEPEISGLPISEFAANQILRRRLTQAELLRDEAIAERDRLREALIKARFFVSKHDMEGHVLAQVGRRPRHAPKERSR